MQLKAYKLPSAIKAKTGKQIKLLADDFRHPSLQCKKMRGREEIWEARVDLQYRITFEIIGDTIFLRTVGSHEDALKSP
ncbi:hypothetical protein A3H38_01380 [candidate division WOR-1 bacterium RIFCSPLOWO2_02_FULL_46_20]|uniref:Cytotoxin n=2 Tax=Saganbacteria TaxID=1703751 RepID=A0A1F4RD79_UNCSA|nr:MAG: hypothetical protein A3J44_02795 [candidate division WOR-1 bacterium RIFCSPHIGHO2_02_FULL_45_12]OGC06108.1 MAG: hypothetical protein A3H38_01380 [candidate division WOR-1 bacterium RIFCSPLOWO2_02_FULL_46_20]OGC09382.1 MAG: hypothetical protein A3F86_02815 [candidate division WOR-1 bacterium RIFCSPLOWO2_12_FULL_45_9]